MALLALVKTGKTKCSRVVFPYTGNGGYKTSRQITVDFSPIHLHFEDDLLGTFSTPQNTLQFVGVNSYPSPLRGVQLTGNCRVKIDGNKSGITPYTHNPADTLYGAVLFKWVQDFFVFGLHFSNGLVNSFRTFQSGHGHVDLVKFSGAGNDNGGSIDFDPGNYNANDPSTWANITVSRWEAWGNNDYGLTAFDASGVTFMHGRTWGNGQLTDPNGVGGGVSMEDSYSSPKTKNYGNRIINVHAFGNVGNAMFITADDVSIDVQSSAKNSTYSDATKADPTQQFGHGVCGISVRKFSCHATIEGNAKAGLKLLGANSVFCDAIVGGTIKGNQQRGIDGQGVATLRVLPSATIESNGLGTVANRENIFVSNASLNNGGGTVYVTGCELSLSGGAAAKCEYVNRVIYSGITGRDPGQSAVTTAGLQIANASYGKIANCEIDGASSQSNVANIANTVAVGGIHNVSGRSISTTAVNNATTKLTAASA